MMILKEYLDALRNLIYPDVCVGCGRMLVKGEELFCLDCYYGLARTDFYKFKDNPAYAKLAGRVSINGAIALLYYVKRGGVQKAIHKLKYGGKIEIGRMLGRELGNAVLKSDFINDVDLIVPIPLHKRKLRKRGYNQSQIIAEGVNEILRCGVRMDLISRDVNTVSQTRFRSRFSRWSNVEKSFKVQNADELKGKHILLIDDVITTGATTESCIKALAEVDGIRISVASLAIALK